MKTSLKATEVFRHSHAAGMMHHLHARCMSDLFLSSLHGPLITWIRRCLTVALAPVDLEVLDEGEQHIGHANAGKGHFHVHVVSAAFTGVTLVERHRLVYAALDELMGQYIHALFIEAKAP